jgi:DinB family protein
VPFEPDGKDWTWVLGRPCPECGFDASAFPAVEVAALIRSNAAAWERLLSGRADDLRRRPSDERWSPLEYACHVRDVCRLYDERLDLMLRRDDPLYANWDQDATAAEDDYNGQDPAVVALELRAAALELAGAFDQVEGAQWQRSGRRSDGVAFTVDTFSRYLVHDPVHHLFDVTGERAPSA